MRGRKPKPTVLRIAQGNPGKRAINQQEPKPASGIPSCPSHVSNVAREEWDRITAELANLGMLTQVDRSMLAAYCDAYSDWVEAQKACSRGMFYKNGDLLKINPALRAKHDAMALMHKFASDFGLSPVSRTRLAVETKTEDDEMETFLRLAE
jgi:P27 family predicted phage terminase small subunit